MSTTQPIATFSGLASGVQWQDLVDQIIQADSTPITRLNQQIADIQAKTVAWGTLKSDLQALDTAAQGLAAGDAFDMFATSLSGLATGETAPFTATAGDGAAPGTYSIETVSLASREKLAGMGFDSRVNALALAGDFVINGVAVNVKATDTLDTIAQRINAADSGAYATGVTASVVMTPSGQYSLQLTSDRAGADTIDLADGPGEVLAGLGVLDGVASDQVKHATPTGMQSDLFADHTTAVSTLLHFTSPPPATVITIGGQPVTLDLSKSLDGIASDIQTATGYTTAVVSETVDGTTQYRLQVDGAKTVGDAGHLGEILGLVTQTKDGGASRSLSTAPLGGTGTSTLGDLGGATGDTIHVTGTYGDGTAFDQTYVIDAATTLDQFAADLSGLLSGATASVSGDQLVVADDSTGTSQLSIQLTANNESGASLNFGDFSVTNDGYSPTVSAGSDAVFRVDGATYTRSTNTVADVIDGVTLSLQKAAPGTLVNLDVSQDTSGVADSVQKLVDAYNGLAKFIASQVPDGTSAAPPLAGDSVLRSIRFAALDAMQGTLASGVAGDWTRLGDVGIAVAKDGTFTFDKAQFQAALDTDAGAVKRLFGLYGTTSDATLGYVQAGDDTQPGTYGVNITHAATSASATSAFTALGAGQTGTITVTDKGTGSAYTVSVDDTVTTGQQLADLLSAELAAATQRTLTSGSTLMDTGAAPATEITALADLSDGSGGNAGINAGDTFDITGTRADGTSFATTFTVSDPATETLGTLQSAIQSELGNDATVAWAGGNLVVTAADTGTNLLGLSVSYGGTGTFALGGMAVSETGRGAAPIDVSADAGGNITLAQQNYGSSAGFTVSFGGSASSTLAGLTDGAEVLGTDVAGTIGGQAAIGSGRTLTGGAGTSVDGLMVTYDGATAGGIGDVTFSRGVASQIEQALSAYLDPYSDGSIQSLVDRLNGQVTSIEDRQSQIQDRLDRRHDALVRQFTAMEMALSKAQSQSQWLSGQIGSLAGYGALLGS